ncbi:MAG: hypothetical protein Q9183_008002 [Haloplaca sp. 2 TL-2023]
MAELRAEMEAAMKAEWRAEIVAAVKAEVMAEVRKEILGNGTVRFGGKEKEEVMEGMPQINGGGRRHEQGDKGTEKGGRVVEDNGANGVV